MKYTWLLIFILFLNFILKGQRPGENEEDVSYTVPISIEYERFLIDSVLSYDEQAAVADPSTSGEKDLEGEHGINVQIYLQDSRFEDIESLSTIVTEVNEFFNFREIRGIDLQISFCLDKVDFLDQSSERLADSVSNQGAYYQREWFSLLKSQLDKTDILEAKQNVIPIVVIDMDAVGFASMAGHNGASDVIVISSRLLNGDIRNRNPVTTLSHLVANYLGVKPLWYNEQGRGDLIDDTPCHDAPNFGNTSDEIHISLCKPMELELSHNLMDNLNDEYRFGFTKGQVGRLVYNLTTNPHREGLLDTPCRDGWQPDELLTLGLIGDDLNITLEPNPANALVSLHVASTSSVNGTFTVINAAGMKVLNGTISDEVTQVDVASLPNGIYYVLSEFEGEMDVLRNRLVITK